MRIVLFFVLIFYSACTLPEERKARQASENSDTTIIETHDANAALDSFDVISLPVAKKIKSPNGIYHTALSNKTEQTIAFNSDLTYQLQEKYLNKEKDSAVITEGTWLPSDGFIWLYKDQVVRGRYKWKGDTLQYYSTAFKKNFSMHHLQDATQNLAWKNKGKEGIVVFAIGNEPFWRVEFDNKDSISFSLPDWNHPIKLKAGSSFNSNDSIGYVAKNDSSEIRVTIFPQFCSDGMSDFVYRNKARVQFNQKVYNGCAILYK